MNVEYIHLFPNDMKKMQDVNSLGNTFYYSFKNKFGAQN
jgi:hypothetical protein